MSEFQQGLMISAIGMGLVFAIIIFLWGLMALIMRVTSREKPGVGAETTDEQKKTKKLPAIPQKNHLTRAVAAALAVRIALERTKTRQELRHKDGVAEGLTPWQTVHRNRQIENKRTRG